MRLPILFFSAVLLISLSSPVAAQDAPYPEERAAIDFSAIDSWFSEPATLEVNIDGVLLGMLSRASRVSDPDISSAISRIESIQVRTYDKTSPELADRIGGLSQHLEEQGWSRVVRVREADETVDVMLNTTNDDVISGLSVFIFKPGDESVFVNIIGEVTPEELGKIGDNFNISPLKRFSDSGFPES